MSLSPAIDHAELSFRIECENIRLFCGEQNLPQVKGPGEIYQDKEGILRFTIHCLEGHSSLIQNRPSFQAGEIIPDELLFSIEATEYNGRTWTASHILPSISLSFSDKGVVRGKVNELKNFTQLSYSMKRYVVHIRVSKKIKFPSNKISETKRYIAGREVFSSSFLGASVIEIDEDVIQINYEQNHTVITASLPQGDYSSNFYLRLKESFEFILAENISISAIEIKHHNILEFHLRSVNQEQMYSRLMPPLQYGDIDTGGSVYNLFKFYYKKIRDYDKPYPHPISHFLRGAVSSSAASLDTEILGLGVAVEGLIQACFTELSPVKAEELNHMNLAIRIIEESCLPIILRKRIIGAINAMKKPRASDRLGEFISHYNLNDRLLSSWKHLRNRSAHGVIISPQKVDETLKLKNDVTPLLYAIIFATINYSGPYTDYSKPGWSTENWCSHN